MASPVAPRSSLPLLLTAFLASAAPALGQVAPPPLRVFLDCDRCDFDHLRTEVPVVDYVRDRLDADLHVLVTRQETGAGGTEFTFHFIGLRALEGQADTLRYVSRQDETENETRDGYTRSFRLGLVRFLALTDRGEAVDVVFRRPPSGERPAGPPTDDPWNLWVFRAQVGGELEGESRQSAQQLNGSFSGSRTTEDFKVDLGVRGNYERDEFELSSGETLVSSARDVSVNATAVWSLGPHWSWGFSGSGASVTSLNQSLAVRAAPALEYSFYPYSEATRRQFTALYRVGLAYFRYEEVTLFEKTRETRPEQSLELAADFTQPWGELYVSLTGSHYLDDPSQHRVELSTNFEIRLLRGLNLDIRGGVSRIKDQIYVALEETSDEDILLQRKELGTDFEYSVDVGLSFTFGSVFNNVVNPRMFSGGNDNWR
jgi:hypothetical protein